MVDLFPDAPVFPVALPDDELRVLRYLPDWDAVAQTVTRIDDGDYAAARRLEKRGLIKLSRWKDDPIQVYPELYGGKLPAATSIRALTPTAEEGK